MEPDKQRKFNFGTGEIDVDQWLRDIDAGLPDYYDRMSKAYHKKENEEVRNAMTDLIGRISSGDMLSRSADGTYNFKSQLYSPNRGKYTRWAYQTALSYLGGKGRGLITPVDQKEELKESTAKKNIYSTQSLLKRFNNSVQRGSTELNLENTWWNSATPEARASHLADFLTNEAKYIRENTDDVDEAYNDLGKEGLATSMSTLAEQLRANPNGDYGRQFGNLGMSNILKKAIQPTEQIKSKTVDEQIQEAQDAEVNKQKQIQLGWIQNKGEDTYFNKDYNFYQNYMQNLNKVHEDRRKGTDISNKIPKVSNDFPTVNGGLIGAVVGNVASADSSYRSHFSDNIEKIKQFLPILQSNWESLFNNGTLSYNDSNGNTLNVSPSQLWENLAILTHQMPDRNGQMGYTYLDNSRNYPISVGDQLYYIPGTYKQNGDILLFDAYNKRLVKSSILNYPELQNTLGTGVLFKKEGGIIKYAGGGQTEDNYTRFGVQPSYTESTQDTSTNQETKTQSYDQPGNFSRPKLTPGDITRLSAMGADIASLATSFGKGNAMSKFSRWTSLAAGVGNFAGDAMNFGGQYGKNANGIATTGWFGHDLADIGIRLYGATPFGNRTVAVRQLSQTLSKNLLQYGRALAPFVLAAFNNADAAKAAMTKAVTGRFGELNTDEWMALATAVEGLLSGKAVQVHTQRARAADNSITSYNVVKSDGSIESMTKQAYEANRRGPFGITTAKDQARGVPVRTQKGFVENNQSSDRYPEYIIVDGEKVLHPKAGEETQKGFWLDPLLHPNRIGSSSESWFNYHTRPQNGYKRKWNQDKGDYEATDMSKMVIGPVREPHRMPSSVLKNLRQAPVDYTTRPAEPELPPIAEPEPLPTVVHQEPEIQVPFAPQEPVATQPTGTIVTEPLVQSTPQNNKPKNNNSKKKKRKHELGGYFKFLRTGGVVVKYEAGGQTGVKFRQGAGSWFDDIFSTYKDVITNKLNTSTNIDADIQWLNGMQKDHSSIYNKAKNTDWQTTAFEDDDIETYQKQYIDGGGFTDDSTNGFNRYGITTNWKTRYELPNKPTSGDHPGQFTPDKLYSAITDDRRLLGRDNDWVGHEKEFEEFNNFLKGKNFEMKKDSDGYYYIYRIDNSDQNSKDKDPNAEKVGSKESERQPNLNVQPTLDKPFDPRALYILGRGASTILGNDWLYDRIYDRLPGPVYKDFIDRKLDTIGDYAALAHGANQSADLKSIQRLRQVSDQTLNLAADFESGRIGREIEDKVHLQDANKQATTHEAALQMDLKDLLDRRDVAWYNRAALNEYLGKRADILNARDKARVDATLGVVNNLTALGTSKYLEKKNAYDQARSVLIRDPREMAMERIKTKYPELYNKVYEGKDLTNSDIARFNQLLSEYQQQARIKYARDYYANYGGTVSYPKKQHGMELGRNGTKLDFIKSLRQ